MGELQAVNIGGRIFFEAEEISRFIASRREHPSQSDSDRASTRPLVGRNADGSGDPSTA